MNSLCGLALLLGSVSNFAFALEDDARLDANLKTFQENPIGFMNSIPQKRDRLNPNSGLRSESVFPADQVNQAATIGGNYVTLKDQARTKFCKEVGPEKTRLCLGDIVPEQQGDKAAMLENPSELVDVKKVVTDIGAMDKDLREGEVEEQPWSDFYWPIFQGVLGNRYAAPGNPGAGNSEGSKNFLDYLKFSEKECSVDDLSPAEKYDLVFGDESKALTDAMWAEGKDYHKSYGKVETWMGICHGWSPASYSVERPTSMVTLKAKDGTKVNFYPSDLKALASLFWAKTDPATRFMGSRCNDKKPETDPDSGRLISEACFDNNPGAWHIAIVNQIGRAKESMVMDATYDYEVWNQPIYSYSYRYFNPKTLKRAQSLKTATVSLADFDNDKFSKFRKGYARGKKPTAVVGVNMTVTYVVETYPSHKKKDSPAEDALREVDYMYDLEIDEDGEILGGEWYSNAHPDFLWTPEPGQQPKSRGEIIAGRKLEDWDTEESVPKSWIIAAKNSSPAGQPVGQFVYDAVTLSRLGLTPSRRHR